MAKGIPRDKSNDSSVSFRADLHPNLKAAFILANPLFNMSDWCGENFRQDVLKVRLISDHHNLNGIIGKFGDADQFRKAAKGMIDGMVKSRLARHCHV
jgi:hypothetical protein